MVLDEYYWNLNDEQWPSPPAPSKAQGIERAAQSVRILIEAIDMRNQGRLDSALLLIDEASSLWPQNPMAYVERCSALCEAQRIDELVNELLRAEQFLFYPSLLTELIPSMSNILPADVVQNLNACLVTRYV